MLCGDQREGKSEGETNKPSKSVKSEKQEHKEGDDVHESVNDVIRADICSPWVRSIGHSVSIECVFFGVGGERAPPVLDFGCDGTTAIHKRENISGKVSNKAAATRSVSTSDRADVLKPPPSPDVDGGPSA